jgi:WhiB family transcriptional regulator, redox-sensing transcriptional regulator
MSNHGPLFHRGMRGCALSPRTCAKRPGPDPGQAEVARGDQLDEREGMAPMQWRAATVGGLDTTGLEASGSAAARREPAAGPMAVPVAGSGAVPVAGWGVAIPAGLDLACTQDPDLFFAESPQDVDRAKAMCRGCSARIACLAGALERSEPWGVWGGELLISGVIVPHKRPRGRPKADVAA